MSQTDSYFLQFSSTENLEQTIHTSRPKHVDIQLWMFNVFIPLFALIIIIVNSIIVISSGLILHRGQQSRSTYIFLGNVALTDLLMGITIMFGHFYPYRSEMICCITMGLTITSTLASVYSVGLIGIDRYLYIIYGLQYQRYITAVRARLMILLTWIIGFIIGFLPAMGIRQDTHKGELCWFVILLPPKLVFVTVSFGVFPLVWIIVLYSIILKHALKKINELKKAGENIDGIQSGTLRLFRGNAQNSVREDNRQNFENGQRSERKFLGIFRKKHKNTAKTAPVYNPSKWKAIKIVLLTTGSFFITWFPFFFASLLYTLCNPDTTPIYCNNLRVAIASPLYILGLTNSILNPIIYTWWDNGFRQSVKKLYKNMFCCRNQSNESTLSHTASTRTRISALSTVNGPLEIQVNESSENQIENQVQSTHTAGTSDGQTESSDSEERVLKTRKKVVRKLRMETNC